MSSPESSFTSRPPATIPYRELENHNFKIIATSPRGQWVNIDKILGDIFLIKQNRRWLLTSHTQGVRVLWLYECCQCCYWSTLLIATSLVRHFIAGLIIKTDIQSLPINNFLPMYLLRHTDHNVYKVARSWACHIGGRIIWHTCHIIWYLIH